MKYSFGGGKYGTLGLVTGAAIFFAETGVDWIVLTSKGTYPTFAAGATEDKKKTTISDFILEETDI